jgi:hypothetical protein
MELLPAPNEAVEEVLDGELTAYAVDDPVPCEGAANVVLMKQVEKINTEELIAKYRDHDDQVGPGISLAIALKEYLDENGYPAGVGHNAYFAFPQVVVSDGNGDGVYVLALIRGELEAYDADNYWGADSEDYIVLFAAQVEAEDATAGGIESSDESVGRTTESAE